MAAVIPRPYFAGLVECGAAFHPTSLVLASPYDRGGAIRLWEIDLDVLLREQAEKPSARPVHHTTGKIVLVGDHSVGKSALGHRLIHGKFKEQASTHGQQFWVYPELGKRRKDGTECEAILWDFAGQPDYRLVNALFVDNADLALVLFDALDLRDPLHGVEFWLKQLQAGQSRCPIILVAAQTDRGTSPLTQEELTAFCRQHHIVGPISTSASTGLGLDELIERMKFLGMISPRRSRPRPSRGSRITSSASRKKSRTARLSSLLPSFAPAWKPRTPPGSLPTPKC
jgi:small GTP-binding protein